MSEPNQVTTPQPPSNGFTRWLGTHRQGVAAADAFEAMQAAVAAVRATGKKAVVTFTITVKPASRGLGGAFVVEDDVTTKLPRLERAQALYYGDEQNILVRDNPQQLRMELKTVEPTTAEPLREVKAG